MFDVDELVDQFRTCLGETDVRRAIRETMTRAMAARREIRDALQPDTGGITALYSSPELTVLDLVWAPGMQLYAHDHRMWACIGIYTGREDNRFYRRDTEGGGRGLVDSGGKTLDDGDVTLLGDDTIHAVHNPLGSATGAIHVYGGDFFTQPRSQWCEPELLEEPFDVDQLTQQFAAANERWLTERSS